MNEEAVLVPEVADAVGGYRKGHGAPNGIENESFRKGLFDCITKVFQGLGRGRREAAYQCALKHELQRSLGLPSMLEYPMPVLYQTERVGVSYVDLLVPKQFFVEVKSVAKLSTKDLLQTMAYSRDLQLVGVLVNFAQTRKASRSFELVFVEGDSIAHRLMPTTKEVFEQATGGRDATAGRDDA
tara:strand:- start:3320 stop:3871 length:552 start_codon:yes stop_codon:yes gene_type:complete